MKENTEISKEKMQISIIGGGDTIYFLIRFGFANVINTC